MTTTSTEARDNLEPKPVTTAAESKAKAAKRRPTFRRVSNSSSIISDIFRHPEASEGKIQKKITEDEAGRREPRDLIDFLRHTTPPPENYMSIPDNFSSSSPEEKWTPFKVFGKRNKSSRSKNRPRLIRLPDSAVAGTTIDGHRYISISIPTKYDHPELRGDVGARDPSAMQLHSEQTPVQTTEPGSSKTLSSTPGAVTILNPVAEDHDTEDLMRARGPGARPRPRSMALTPPISLTSLPGSATTSPTNNGFRTKQQELIRPQPADTPQVICRPPSSSWQNPYQYHKKKPSSSSSSSGYISPFITSSPRRRSSMGVVPGHSRQESFDNGLLSTHNNRDPSARASIAESILTTGSEPVIVDATTAHGYVPVSAHEGDTNLQRTTTNPDTVVFTPVLELPNDSFSASGDKDDDTNSVSSAPETTVERQLSQSRRETARRLASILHGRERGGRKSTSPPLHLRPSPARQPEVITERSWMAPLERSRAGSIQDLQVTPVMVVADINPSGETTPSQFKREPNNYQSRQPSGGPAMTSLDRMTYTQLHEPVFERSRGPAETGPTALGDKMQMLHRKVEAMAAPYLKQGSGMRAGAEDRNILFSEPRLRSAQDRDRELATEARLARLERNGDAWLGTVVPLLESIERSLARMSGRDSWRQPQPQQPVSAPEEQKERPRTWPEKDDSNNNNNNNKGHGHKRALSEAERLGLPSALTETQMWGPETGGSASHLRGKKEGKAPAEKDVEPSLTTRMRAALRSMGRRDGEETEEDAGSRSAPNSERDSGRPRRSRSVDESGISLRGGSSGANLDNLGPHWGVTSSGRNGSSRTPLAPFTYRGVTGLFRKNPDYDEIRRLQITREREIELSLGTRRYARNGLPSNQRRSADVGGQVGGTTSGADHFNLVMGPSPASQVGDLPAELPG